MNRRVKIEGMCRRAADVMYQLSGVTVDSHGGGSIPSDMRYRSAARILEDPMAACIKNPAC